MEIKIATISGSGTPVYQTRQTVNSGTIVIYCDGTCDDPRLDHRYMGYDSEEATALYNESHNGGDGLN